MQKIFFQAASFEWQAFFQGSQHGQPLQKGRHVNVILLDKNQNTSILMFVTDIDNAVMDSKTLKSAASCKTVFEN